MTRRIDVESFQRVTHLTNSVHEKTYEPLGIVLVDHLTTMKFEIMRWQNHIASFQCAMQSDKTLSPVAVTIIDRFQTASSCK